MYIVKGQGESSLAPSYKFIFSLRVFKNIYKKKTEGYGLWDKFKKKLTYFSSLLYIHLPVLISLGQSSRKYLYQMFLIAAN